MLAIAGNLDKKIGGQSVDLSIDSNNRRTLYGVVSRHHLDPLLRLYDFPDPNATSDGRPVTSVPLQQLFVLNSDFMARQAKVLAARISGSANDDDGRVRNAYRWLYGRAPSDRETRLGKQFVAAGK